MPEGAESEATFERLAREGNKVIFATSFGYMDQMLAVAAKYPDVVFMHATGYKTAANMGTYFGAAEEARYLTGMAAVSYTHLDVYKRQWPVSRSTASASPSQPGKMWSIWTAAHSSAAQTLSLIHI